MLHLYTMETIPYRNIVYDTYEFWIKYEYIGQYSPQKEV